LKKDASLREWACLSSPFSKEIRLMSKATTTKKVDYFHLPRPLWRKLKKCLPSKKKRKSRHGGRPRASDRAVVNGIWYVLWTGCQWKAVHRDWFAVSSSVIHERFQRWTRLGLFEKLMRKMVEYYAKERGGIGWRWQAMDSKNSPAPLGGEKTGKNPTDRGKRGAKINLMVDQSGAPLSVVLTGANRHDKVAAIELIVSVAIKRPAHKEQHLCADKAYDATDVREFAASAGYTTHIKVNPRKKCATESSGESSEEKDSPGESHPARRWVVERTISWLTKPRSLRIRWSKKAQNWLALIQLACAHVLLNLAVLG
jgi:putative transposase